MFSLWVLLHALVLLSCVASPVVPPPSTLLFPYTTLFRSQVRRQEGVDAGDIVGGAEAVQRNALENLGLHVVGQLAGGDVGADQRSEEHTSELQSRFDLVCRLLPEKKNDNVLIQMYYTRSP